MTNATVAHVEPLTYWVRIEDIIAEPGIDSRLIKQAFRGLLTLEGGGDLASWVEESERLLDLVDLHLARIGEPDSESLQQIGRSAPVVESLRSLLAALRPAALDPVSA